MAGSRDVAGAEKGRASRVRLRLRVGAAAYVTCYTVLASLDLPCLRAPTCPRARGVLSPTWRAQ